MKRGMAAVVLMGLVAAGGASQAQPGPQGEGADRPMPGRRMEQRGPAGNPEFRNEMILRIIDNPRVKEQLGLTDEQAKKLKDGYYDIQKQRIELRSRLELAGLDQARLLTAEGVPDEKELMAAVEKTGGIRTELAKLEMKGLLLARSVLTDEQRVKLRKMAARWAEEHMGNPGERRPMMERRAPRGGREGDRDRADERRPPRGPGPGGDNEGMRPEPPPPGGPDAPPPPDGGEPPEAE